MRSKTYNYLTDNSDEKKSPKGTKNCVIKQKIKFQDYKHFLEAAQLKH